MPRSAASCPVAPALPHCMPCIVSSIRIPPDASHALHCLDRSATPALSQCRVFIHHVLDVIARNRICPVFSILSYHTLLIRLIHSILFHSIPFHSILSYPILSYPIPPIYPPARLARVHLACFPGISVPGVPPKHPTCHSFLHPGNRKRAAS